MRIIDQNASTKVTAASTTVTFTASDVPANGVVAYHGFFTGAGMTLGDVTRFRVKSGGQTIFDMDNAHYVAFMQRLRRGKRVPQATDTTFTIPFWLPDVENEDMADLSQMPFGQPPTIEIVIGAGGAAGTLQFGYTVSNIRPQLYPVALGSQMNIAASVNQARFPFTEPGIVLGFQVNSVGLTRLQASLGGVKRVEIEGTSMLFEATANDQTADLATDVVDPVHVKLVGGQSAPQGSALVLDTAVGWAGVANEAVIHGVRSQLVS